MCETLVLFLRKNCCNVGRCICLLCEQQRCDHLNHFSSFSLCATWMGTFVLFVIAWLKTLAQPDFTSSSSDFSCDFSFIVSWTNSHHFTAFDRLAGGERMLTRFNSPDRSTRNITVTGENNRVVSSCSNISSSSRGRGFCRKTRKTGNSRSRCRCRQCRNSRSCRHFQIRLSGKVRANWAIICPLKVYLTPNAGSAGMWVQSVEIFRPVALSALFCKRSLVADCILFKLSLIIWLNLGSGFLTNMWSRSASDHKALVWFKWCSAKPTLQSTSFSKVSNFVGTMWWIPFETSTTGNVGASNMWSLSLKTWINPLVCAHLFCCNVSGCCPGQTKAIGTCKWWKKFQIS